MKMIESFDDIKTIEAIQQAQRDIDDILTGLANDQVKDVVNEVEYSSDFFIESHHMQDYLTILRLKKFVRLTIADKVFY